MDQVRLPAIPEQCRMHHPWGPGTVAIEWRACDCPAAACKGRGGHITVTCLFLASNGIRCSEEWVAPMHQRVPAAPLGHHRPAR